MVQLNDLCPEKKSDGVYALILDELPHSIAHPKDLVEPLSFAMSSNHFQQEKIDIADIKLYSLYEKKDGSFAGSLYAVEQDDGYFGSVVGETDICFFSKDNVECKETNEVFVPLRVEDDWAWILICEYNREEVSLTAKCLKKMDTPTQQNEEVLHEFEAGTSFEDAYDFFQKSN